MDRSEAERRTAQRAGDQVESEGSRGESVFNASVTMRRTAMNKRGQDGKQRDRPRFRARLWNWLQRWGADILLVWGAGCVCAGVGWLCPPAGLIAAGALLIAGGVLWAKGGGGP